MPRQRDFPLYERPSTYGFEPLDDLVQRLRVAIPDAEILTQVLAALRIEGRRVDSDHLAGHLRLEDPAVAIIEELASWGNQGEQIHHYASVRIASITAGSLLGHTDLTTFVFAQRVEDGLTVFFEDENGGHGELGEFERPLSLLELTIVIDGILFRGAPYDIVDGTWQSGYFAGSAHVGIPSTGWCARGLHAPLSWGARRMRTSASRGSADRWSPKIPTRRCPPLFLRV